MDRREALKALGFTTFGTGFFLEACRTSNKESTVVHKNNVEEVRGRQDYEVERLKKIRSRPDFFTEHEMLTITALSDIIIPEDEVSGSASDAKVPEFIEFIVKDIPKHQTPMRGGLKWLDIECISRYDHSFIECNSKQQLAIVEDIAYPSKATPGMEQGIAFFNRMRNLTASGFYTSKIGIEDIGYKGNTPTMWDGVPEKVLARYDVEEF